MSLHARLYDGRGVENDLSYLLSNLTYNSLLDSGPPAGFQIDGNFGGCAAIAEALLQSHNGVVTVLPALLPSASTGSFSGLVARGGFVVNATWANGFVSHLAVLSRLGNPLNLTLGTGQLLSLAGALPFNSSGVNASASLSMNTARGATYNFVTSS
jgi:alpha-L-fucosidase 2